MAFQKAASSAASGAMAGMALGPIGAIVGGALGAVSGMLASDAEKAMRIAQRQRAKITNMQNFEARRSFMRDFYTQQARVAVSGASMGLDSSAAQGSAASIVTQQQDELNRLGQKEYLDKRAQKFERRAGAKASQSATVGAIGQTVAGITSAVDDFRGL